MPPKKIRIIKKVVKKPTPKPKPKPKPKKRTKPINIPKRPTPQKGGDWKVDLLLHTIKKYLGTNKEKRIHYGSIIPETYENEDDDWDFT
jgi:hypothetical protein